MSFDHHPDASDDEEVSDEEYHSFESSDETEDDSRPSRKSEDERRIRLGINIAEEKTELVVERVLLRRNYGGSCWRIIE